MKNNCPVLKIFMIKTQQVRQMRLKAGKVYYLEENEAKDLIAKGYARLL